MNEIAETASDTALTTIESAACFTEICHGTEFTVYRTSSVPATVELVAGSLCRVFVFEASVDIADEMIVRVVTDYHLFYLAKLAHLAPEILVEGIEMMLELSWCHLVLWVVGWVLIHVGEKDCLAVGWLNVFSAAPVAVSACADLVVETAVDFILFCSEDGSEIGRHCEGLGL